MGVSPSPIAPELSAWEVAAYLLTYLLTYLPTGALRVGGYLLTYLRTYLLTYLLTYRPVALCVGGRGLPHDVLP